MIDQTRSRLPDGTTVKRFLGWKLDGEGMVHGGWPLADAVEPDAYVELHYQGKKVVGVREWLEGEANPIERVFTLDAHGRLVKSERVGPHPELRLLNTYKYDGAGNLAERQEKEVATGKLRFRTTSKVSRQGDIIEDAWHDGGGQLRERVTYERDEKGRCVKEAHYDGGSGGKKLVGFFVLEYDGAGHEVKRVWHDRKGAPSATTVTEYGDVGDLPVKVTVTPRDGVAMSMALEYAPNGKRTNLALCDADGERVFDKDTHLVAGSRRKSYRQPPPLTGDGSAGTLKTGAVSELHRQALTMLAYDNFKKERYKTALPLFEKAMAADPNDLYAVNAAGACALKLGYYELAVDYYERVLAKEPENPQSLKGLESARRALGRG